MLCCHSCKEMEPENGSMADSVELPLRGTQSILPSKPPADHTVVAPDLEAMKPGLLSTEQLLLWA